MSQSEENAHGHALLVNSCSFPDRIRITRTPLLKIHRKQVVYII